MLPSDAPVHDWRLYYDRTYMRHSTLGPCFIRVENDSNAGYELVGHVLDNCGNIGRRRKFNAKELRIMWPRPGAYNLNKPKCGIFIGRQPQRHMKRSAYMDHYYLTWCPNIAVASNYLNQAIMASFYWNVEELRNKLVSESIISGALSIRTCLHKKEQEIEVIYMAESIGILDKDNKLVSYMPDDSRLPRFKKHLSTVGIK